MRHGRPDHRDVLAVVVALAIAAVLVAGYVWFWYELGPTERQRSATWAYPLAAVVVVQAVRLYWLDIWPRGAAALGSVAGYVVTVVGLEPGVLCQPGAGCSPVFRPSYPLVAVGAVVLVVSLYFDGVGLVTEVGDGETPSSPTRTE